MITTIGIKMFILVLSTSTSTHSIYIQQVSDPMPLELCINAMRKYSPPIEPMYASLNCIEEGTLQQIPWDQEPEWQFTNYSEVSF